MPHEWFPQARKMKRKIIYHHGPTNSGKTFSAMENLEKAEKGIYCAPLRLLAWEVFLKNAMKLIYRFMNSLNLREFHVISLLAKRS